MPKTVLISGASIAGPALAYWLHRYGFDVTVVERAPALRPGGQAIDFKGRTHLTVLERMGILDEIEERQTGTTDTVFVDANGKRLAVMAGDFAGGDVEILRGDLADIMYQRTAERCEYLSVIRSADSPILPTACTSSSSAARPAASISSSVPMASTPGCGSWPSDRSGPW